MALAGPAGRPETASGPLLSVVGSNPTDLVSEPPQQRGLFETGVEAVPDRGSEERRRPPGRGPPNQTKAWRKSWRKRWREGSSYRQLSTLERCIVSYVEDNADDEGRVTTTTRFLAEVMTPMGRGHHQVSNVTVWRAIQRCVELGVLTADVVEKVKQNSQRNSQHGPTTLTRVNYRRYQDPVAEDVTELVTDVVEEVKRSSRGKQKKAERDLVLDALVDAMRQKYLEVVGEAYDYQDRQLGDLIAVRSLIPDDEILRRWEDFLRHKFWPIKNFNRFRAAQSAFKSAKTRKVLAAYGHLPPIPGIPNEQP